jgi:hypothetical protein
MHASFRPAKPNAINACGPRGCSFAGLALFVPLGATVQVTAMLPLDTLATAAANCCVWDAPRVTEEGVTLTDTGG